MQEHPLDALKIYGTWCRTWCAQAQSWVIVTEFDSGNFPCSDRKSDATYSWMSLLFIKCAHGCTCISHWESFNMFPSMMFWQHSDNTYIYIYIYIYTCPSPVQFWKQIYFFNIYRYINMLSVTHSRRLLSTNSDSTDHIPQVQWWLKGLYKLHSNSMLTAWCHLGLGALVQLLSVLLQKYWEGPFWKH